MDEHRKLENMLEMVMLLSDGYGKTIEEIAERYDITERTVERYIKTFRDIGFVIPRPKNSYYKIEKLADTHKGLNKLLYFSEEEALILQNILFSLNESSPIKQNLLAKLNALCDSGRLAEIVCNQKDSENIHRLSSAIKEEKQVILKGYQSANSNKRRDRIVEPFEFTSNYVSTWAYDVDAQSCKVFKNTRIKSVEVLSKKWEYEHKHWTRPVDVFRLGGDEQIEVELELSVRSCELLKEEYPLSLKYISEIGSNKFIFKAPVYSFKGVGRFIMGLYDDINVIKPKELQEYIKEKAKEILNRQ
ncbi:MAG: helix-turn-helix transcriptional regulator [Bacteroidales bacterium]